MIADQYVFLLQLPLNTFRRHDILSDNSTEEWPLFPETKKNGETETVLSCLWNWSKVIFEIGPDKKKEKRKKYKTKKRLIVWYKIWKLFTRLLISVSDFRFGM